MARRRGYRQLVEADLDIMPLMNLFVVLIPMLLLSAVFVEMSAIDMELPGDDPQQAREENESLELAVRLEDDRWVVSGRRLAAQVIAREGEDAEERLEAVLRAIRDRHPHERSVRIESPAAARYQDIVTVMDVSRAAGLGAIALASAPSNPRRAR
jgi:biopolymer transport protein ExbD